MSTQEVADKLVNFCREGKYDEAYNLYADDAVSKEMSFMPNNRTEGKENIIQEYQQWATGIEEMHGGEVGNPVVAGNYFAVPMSYDITFKDRGREQMEEICLYKVANGKIAEVSFHYEAPPGM